MRKEILKIVREAFDNNISTWTGESVMGVESGITGKEDFFKEIEEKVNQFLEDGLEPRDYADLEGTKPIWKKRDYDGNELWDEVMRLRGIEQ